MSDQLQLTPLQLGQALTLLSSSVRELTTQMIELRTTVQQLATRIEGDRAELRGFARDIKRTLEESATSQSQEMRAARINTPLPPRPYKHGTKRP